jgi:UPF0755 protein
MAGPGDPPSDEFGRTDADALERERRRLEREGRRRAREGRATAEQSAAGASVERPRAARSKPNRPPRGKPVGTELVEWLAAARQRLSTGLSARLSARRSKSADPDIEPAPAEVVPRHPRNAGHARGPRIALGIVLLLLLALYWMLFQPFHGEGTGKVVVTIPKGAGSGQIADILDQRGIVSHGSVFEFRLRLSGKGDDIQAGNYTLAGDMSYSDAIEALTEHAGTPTTTISITIPEGDSRSQIAAIAREVGLGGDYMKATKRSKLINPRKYGAKRASSLEGFLFPASYELKPRAGVRDLVAQQLTAFKQNIKGVNMKYARKKNLNTYDVLTIAAMVEREVQVAKERPLVAAVIYNRLKQGIPLGIDATTRYATNNYDKPLRESELASSSPYNTRKFSGLPPGPIGNPGLASIRAAAKPAKIGYLYYVVKPGTCGEHSFTKSAAEFDRLVARYNQAREQAGGKSPDTCPGG